MSVNVPFLILATSFLLEEIEIVYGQFSLAYNVIEYIPTTVLLKIKVFEAVLCT